MENKGKILVFSPYYYPHIGGLEGHAREFNKMMENNGWSVTVWTPRLPISGEKEEFVEGIKILRYPAFEIIPNYPLPKFWKKEYWEMFSDIKNESWKWVLSRTRFFYSSLLAGLFSKRYKVKWLHVEHGSDSVKQNNLIVNSIAWIVDMVIGRWVLKSADIVVANSNASSMFCSKIYPSRKYEVVYRGVDKDLLDSVKVFETDNKLLYVGRLIEGKGVADLISAFAMVNDKSISLEIIGDGPQRKELEKIVQTKKLKEKIKFLGQMDRRSAIEKVANCSVVINPSYTEGLPTSIVEAAWFGKAIIATDVGGTNEIVENGKSGILVEPKNIKELANAIKKITNDKNFAEKCGKTARESVRKKFDWEVSIQKYIYLMENYVRDSRKN